MAATGQVTVTLQFKPTNGITQTLASGGVNISPAQDPFVMNVMNAGTSKTALPLGGVSSSDLGYCYLQNLDQTNYVSIYSDNSAATEICRLLPGANSQPGPPVLINFGPSSTPFLAAHTAPCNVSYFLCSQ